MRPLAVDATFCERGGLAASLGYIRAAIGAFNISRLGHCVADSFGRSLSFLFDKCFALLKITLIHVRHPHWKLKFEHRLFSTTH